jgi:hypothetical protein
MLEVSEQCVRVYMGGGGREGVEQGCKCNVRLKRYEYCKIFETKT